MSAHESPSPASAHPDALVREVRYSLPELLAEIKLEQAAGVFAQEKLSQAEIAKLFAATPKRRVKKPQH